MKKMNNIALTLIKNIASAYAHSFSYKKIQASTPKPDYIDTKTELINEYNFLNSMIAEAYAPENI
jgi:hypothetical protein